MIKISNIFVLFYDVHKENMFTINLEDGCKAPSKASILKLETLDAVSGETPSSLITD